MHNVEVSILRMIDDHYPGFVECELIDLDGKRHMFVDKLPIFEGDEADVDAGFPRIGYIRCQVVRSTVDTALIDTGLPDAVESKSGETRFLVRLPQIVSD